MARKDGFLPAALSGAALLAGYISSMAYLVSGTYNPFLYFRF